ncbi:hypothetical protein T492DRAFT_863714 [Pavlovales sp. CCMP2436]|nr:hypothetical protein T492DRAFT_863714 [Pavlovales sp. CCMP2436]
MPTVAHASAAVAAADRAHAPKLTIGPIEAKLNTVKPIRVIVIGAFGEVSANTHSLVKEIAAQGGRKMYALMGVSPMEAAARIKKQLIDTIGTIAARGHAQLLLARLSALAPIAAQRGNTTNSNQQIISLNALARAHYRRSIGTRGAAFVMGGVLSDDVDMPNLLSFIPLAPQLHPPLLEAINESYGNVFLLVQKAGPDSIKDDITLARKMLALMPILNTGSRPVVPSPWAPSTLELDAGLLSRYRKASIGLHPEKFNSIPNITIYDEFKAGMLYKLGAAAKATIKGQPANDVQDATPNPRSTDWFNNFHFHARDLPTEAPSLLERMDVARAAQDASPYLTTAQTASHTAAVKIHNALPDERASPAANTRQQQQRASQPPYRAPPGHYARPAQRQGQTPPPPPRPPPPSTHPPTGPPPPSPYPPPPPPYAPSPPADDDGPPQNRQRRGDAAEPAMPTRALNRARPEDE